MLEYIIIGVLLFLVILQGWWIYKSLNKFILIRDLFSDVRGIMEEYVEHLDSVHNMERFFGEPVLERLLEHGKQTQEIMNDFLEVFSDFEQEGELQLQEFYDEEEEQ